MIYNFGQDNGGGWIMNIELITPSTHKYFNSYKEVSEYLTSSLCTECWKELSSDIPTSVMLEMSDEEWVQEMLTTACGAEWFIEEVEWR